jgi:hypothetical protein
MNQRKIGVFSSTNHYGQNFEAGNEPVTEERSCNNDIHLIIKNQLETFKPRLVELCTNVVVTQINPVINNNVSKLETIKNIFRNIEEKTSTFRNLEAQKFVDFQQNILEQRKFIQIMKNKFDVKEESTPIETGTGILELNDIEDINCYEEAFEENENEILRAITEIKKLICDNYIDKQSKDNVPIEEEMSLILRNIVEGILKKDIERKELQAVEKNEFFIVPKKGTQNMDILKNSTRVPYYRKKYFLDN